MSDHDAHKALSDTARLRMLPPRHDPLEDTQRMSIGARRDRQIEARIIHCGVYFRDIKSFSRFPI